MREYLIKLLGGYTEEQLLTEAGILSKDNADTIWKPFIEALHIELKAESLAAECLKYKFQQMLLGNKQKYNGRTVIAVPVCNRKRNKQGKYCK